MDIRGRSVVVSEPVRFRGVIRPDGAVIWVRVGKRGRSCPSIGGVGFPDLLHRPRYAGRRVRAVFKSIVRALVCRNSLRLQGRRFVTIPMYITKAGLLWCEWVNRVGVVQSIGGVGIPGRLHRLMQQKQRTSRCRAGRKDIPECRVRERGDSGVLEPFGKLCRDPCSPADVGR